MRVSREKWNTMKLIKALYIFGPKMKQSPVSFVPPSYSERVQIEFNLEGRSSRNKTNHDRHEEEVDGGSVDLG